MGACASVPKAMKDEVAAPLPEPKEETTTAAAEVKAADKEVTVEGEEKKAEDHEENKDGEDDEHQCLGSLLKEGEEVKDSAEAEKTPEAEDQNSEELPVSSVKPAADDVLSAEK